MDTLLKSRISRRVIAEQHLALTETFNSPWHFPDAAGGSDMNGGFVGEVFLRWSVLLLRFYLNPWVSGRASTVSTGSKFHHYGC